MRYSQFTEKKLSLLQKKLMRLVARADGELSLQEVEIRVLLKRLNKKLQIHEKLGLIS